MEIWRRIYKKRLIVVWFEWMEKGAQEKTRDNDTRERDCIKPVVSCFIYGKNLHFCFHCFLLFNDNNNNSSNDWSWGREKKRQNATSRMNCLFYETDELSFTIISASEYSFLLSINICKNVFGVGKASKFFTDDSIIRQLKSGMLFNSLFSCSQSNRLDAMLVPDTKCHAVALGLWTIIHFCFYIKMA